MKLTSLLCAAILTLSTLPLRAADPPKPPIPGPGNAALANYFESTQPGGNTNTLAALERAYARPDVDTIVLFTDGAPDTGFGFDERMASRIKLSADTAVDEDDLWMAALGEVQFEPRSAKSPTAHLAAIWNEAA